MIVADTSVIIAALCTWHDHHDAALRTVSRLSTVIGHTVIEAYSVLTRLPEPYRVMPELAAEALDRRFKTVVTLPDKQLRNLPTVLARAGVAGGATYDGLIAVTAVHHDAELASLDERATNTYRKCGATVMPVQ